MKLSWLVIVLSLSARIAAQPQQLSIDSLKQELSVANQDTTRVMLLRTIGSRHLLSDPASAEKYFQEGLTLSRKLNYRKGEADCLRWLGNVLKRQGQYPKALDNFIKGLAISEHIRDSSGISAALGHIGTIYSEQGDHYKARSYFFKAKAIDEKRKNINELLLMLVNIGRSYYGQKALDSAFLYLDQCYRFSLERKNYIMMDVLLTTQGQIKAAQGHDDQAMIFFRKSIPYSIAKNAHANLSDTYSSIAALHKKSGQRDSCIIYGKKSLASAETVKYVKGIMTVSQLLSDAYEDSNNTEAFKYYKIAMAAKDSLFNTEKVRQLQNLSFAEQQRLKALEDMQIEYRNRVRSYTLLSLVGTFVLIAIILFINNRNKQKANTTLKQQKEEIQRTLTELKLTQAQLVQSEKMASLGELTAGIAHEIQNPLNFVNNFSEVNKDLLFEMVEEIKKGNFEDVKSLADSVAVNQEKINQHGKRADAIVKGMLQHSRSSSGVKESVNINSLADEYLRLAYHGLRAKDKTFNVTLKTSFDERIGTINAVQQDIGRVILNLLNNAFYAVHEKAKLKGDGFEPLVSIGTKQSGDKVLISVKDNGIGISKKIMDKIFQPFFTTKPTGQGTGLGLSLSYDIVRAHNGTITTNSNQNEGSEFIIELPMG